MLKYFTVYLISLIFGILNVQYLYAQTTNWKNCPGGKARFMLLSERSNIYKGAIEIDLNEGWKTFWHNPGTNGMAPNINLNTDIQKDYKIELLYPSPMLHKDGSEWANIYKNKVYLPVKLSKINDSTKNISGNINVGFCKNMCIPLNFNFDFSQNELKKSDFIQQAQIENAFLSLPRETTNELKKVELEHNNLILSFITKQNLSTKPQLFIGSENTEFGLPKLIKTKDNISVFSTPILSPLKKHISIYYNLLNKEDSIVGQIIL